MARPHKPAKTAIQLLTARQVLAATAGDLLDGGGLTLRVNVARASWVLRYTAPSGRRREMGLGIAHRGSLSQAGDSLTGARDAAHRAREQLRHGIDPIEARAAQREGAKTAVAAAKAERRREELTLARAARDYHERVIEPSRSTKHSAQWLASLKNHVPAAL